jgi:hypothetical protein
VLPILLVVYQYRLVKALRPAATWMHEYVVYAWLRFYVPNSLDRSTTGGWLIPIAILTVMSFPPVRMIVEYVGSYIIQVYSVASWA